MMISNKVTAVNITTKVSNSTIVKDIQQGPKGDKGDAANNYYKHEQPTPALVWEVTHNLNMYASVTVVDSANSVVIGEVTYIDLNSVRITFSAPFSGYAYFS